MITPETKFGFNDRSYGRLKFAISSSAVSFDLLFVTPFLPGWAANKDLYATFRAPDGTMEIIKIIDISGHTLTVERGQEGTVAVAWHPGSLLVQRLTAGGLGTIIQKGEFRSIAFNPNGVLAGAYPGEKVYESGSESCQVRWWLNNGGTKWRMLAGTICSWEFYDGEGYPRVAFMDFVGDDDDGYIQYENANWTTCRTAPTGDLVNDDGSGFLYGIRATTEYNAVVYKIRRSFLFFDLAGAPMGITQVELYIKGKSGGGDPLVLVQEGTQGKPLSTADYDAFTGSVFALLDPGTTDADYVVPLNFDGVYYMELVVALGGIAKFCLREYDHDFGGLTVPAYYNYSLMFYDNDYPTPAYRPFLRLRYD